MVEIANRLSAPEFWLSVIIGPIVAALITEHLKGKTIKQWLRGLTWATGALLSVCWIALLVYDGISLDNIVRIGMAAMVFGVAAYGTSGVQTFTVIGINLPIVLMIGAALHKSGMAEVSRNILGLAFIYDMVATLILILVLAWAIITRPWETSEK